jgi:hypothetical protein
VSQGVVVTGEARGFISGALACLRFQVDNGPQGERNLVEWRGNIVAQAAPPLGGSWAVQIIPCPSIDLEISFLAGSK